MIDSGNPPGDSNITNNKTVSYAPAIIKLLQGVIYPDDSGWEALRTHLLEVERYFSQIGVHLEYVEGEYAYLSQPRTDRASDDDESRDALPRLVRSRALSYFTTLLCALLRERLMEHEAQQDQGLPTISREDIYERMMPFVQERGSQSAMQSRINGTINDAIELGFIKEVKDKETYQIRGIVKARVTADMLADLLAQLKEQAGLTTHEES